jgi:hypothetical protein
MKAFLDRCCKRESRNRFRENLVRVIPYIVVCAPASIETCKLSLTEWDDDPEEDKNYLLYAQYIVDMVYSGYAAAKNRLRLYVYYTHTATRSR